MNELLPYLVLFLIPVSSSVLSAGVATYGSTIAGHRDAVVAWALACAAAIAIIMAPMKWWPLIIVAGSAPFWMNFLYRGMFRNWPYGIFRIRTVMWGAVGAFMYTAGYSNLYPDSAFPTGVTATGLLVFVGLSAVSIHDELRHPRILVREPMPKPAVPRNLADLAIEIRVFAAVLWIGVSTLAGMAVRPVADYAEDVKPDVADWISGNRLSLIVIGYMLLIDAAMAFRNKWLPIVVPVAAFPVLVRTWRRWFTWPFAFHSASLLEGILFFYSFGVEMMVALMTGQFDTFPLVFPVWWWIVLALSVLVTSACIIISGELTFPESD